MFKTKSVFIRFYDLSTNARNVYILSKNRTNFGSNYGSNESLNSLSFRCFSTQNSSDFRKNRSNDNFWYKSAGLLATIGTTVGIVWLSHRNALKVSADKSTDGEEFTEFGREVNGLKTYSSEEVSKHNELSKRIWCSFRSGVYDITEFVSQHPGGDKILMASGGALEPFWTLFAVHKTKEVFTLLETFRIGNLDKKDRTDQKKLASEVGDPYANDPIRHPVLIARSKKPFNAEPPQELLVQSFITPNELFFVRNHLPVPEVDVNNYTLDIEGFGLKSPKSLTLNEIKTKFPKHSVMATIQCAGNRRDEMNKIKEVKGLAWGLTAISNAEWSGARLVDVLKYCDLDFDDPKIKHLQFEGLDFDVSSNPYGGSVESLRALNPKSDFLIAYEMNGEDIPLDHGFPLRLIAPGIVGARNVKWLARIVLSDEESHSHWQRNDYKGFSPNIDWHNVDFESAPSIQELPVQSAICEPKEGQTVVMDSNRNIRVSGYAWSGGGKKIIRVDVSADNGKNWITAELKQEDSPINRTYSWSLWEALIPAPKEWKSGHKIELICRAHDSHYNTQPEDVKHLWNLRGVLNNSWHRIHCSLK